MNLETKKQIMITKSHYNKCFKIYKKLLMKHHSVNRPVQITCIHYPNPNANPRSQHSCPLRSFLFIILVIPIILPFISFFLFIPPSKLSLPFSFPLSFSPFGTLDAHRIAKPSIN